MYIVVNNSKSVMFLNTGDGESKTMPGVGIRLMPGTNKIDDEKLWELATVGGMAKRYLTDIRTADGKNTVLEAAKVEGNFDTLRAEVAVGFVASCGDLVFLNEQALTEKRPTVAKAIQDRIKKIMTPRKPNITESAAP
jgi:hypothetical protein